MTGMADTDVQEKIDQMYDDMTVMDGDRSDFYSKVYYLAESVGRATLFAEMLRYSAEQATKDERKSWWALLAANYARNGLPTTSAVEALVPLLTDEDKTVRSRARSGLQMFEGEGQTLSYLAGYSHLRGYLKRKDPDTISPRLYKEIYDLDPARAMFTMARAYGVDGERNRSLQWKEHLVSTALFRLRFRENREVGQAIEEARQALQEMAEDDAWWVRLYAAHRATDRRTGPVLADDELRRKLREDPHELVADIAGRQEE